MLVEVYCEQHARWESDEHPCDGAAVLARAYCDRGHPAHDLARGCGPCQDEDDAKGATR